MDSCVLCAGLGGAWLIIIIILSWGGLFEKLGPVGLYVQKYHGLWIIYIVLSGVLLHILRTKTAIQVHHLTGT